MTEKDKPFRRVVITGCGDIGRRVAKSWKIQGKTVFGIVKSEDSIDRLRQQHIHALQADLDTGTGLENLPVDQALVYYFAPPPAQGDKDTRMAHFLESLQSQPHPARIIYLGTSGVYGDQQGELVNEKTPPKPQVERAKRRYDAEQQLQRWCEQQEVELTILRVGGIYGPERLPLQRIKDQVPMLLEALAPQTNRIHEDDLAQVCVAAASPQAAGEIYNVSDGTNSNMTEYFLTIADAYDLPHPPLVDWDEAEKSISKGMLSYLKESRKLDNSKMLKELEIELQYPTLKDALEHMHK